MGVDRRDSGITEGANSNLSEFCSCDSSSNTASGVSHGVGSSTQSHREACVVSACCRDCDAVSTTTSNNYSGRQVGVVTDGDGVVACTSLNPGIAESFDSQQVATSISFNNCTAADGCDADGVRSTFSFDICIFTKGSDTDGISTATIYRRICVQECTSFGEVIQNDGVSTATGNQIA